jgi:hypothetical protein
MGTPSPLSRLAAFAVATVAVVGLVLVAGARLLSVAAPDGEVLTALAELQRAPPTVELLRGTLVARRASFDRVSVAPSAEGGAVRLTATLDFQGQFTTRDGGTVTVSSLGLERPTFQRRAGAWRVAGSPYPDLSGVLDALSAEAPCDQVPCAGASVAAWYVRVEREGATASGDYVFPDGGGAGTRRRALRPAAGGWVVEP